MANGNNVLAQNRSLVEKVQESIVEILMGDECDDEGYILSEGELCKKFGVSRVTVREAVRSLEVRGYVKRIHGKGIKKIDHSVQAISKSLRDMLERNKSNYAELLETRRVIERQNARMAALRADESDLEELKNLIMLMQDASIDYNDYLKYDLKFHIVIAKASKNKIFESITIALQPLLLDCIKASTDNQTRPEISERYHQKIYEAILARDSDMAEIQIIRHLQATEENIK